MSGLKIFLNLMKVIICYNEEKDEGHFLENDVQYPKNLCNLHNYFPYLPERMKIEKSKTL